eukprot:COSAG02_NODE_1373_length_13014_cov_5.725358_3_plen_166_part_00
MSARHWGHLAEWVLSSAIFLRPPQSPARPQQKVWPHGVVIGSLTESRQSAHTMWGGDGPSEQHASPADVVLDSALLAWTSGMLASTPEAGASRDAIPSIGDLDGTGAPAAVAASRGRAGGAGSSRAVDRAGAPTDDIAAQSCTEAVPVAGMAGVGGVVRWWCGAV